MFDKNKKISQADLDTITMSFILTPSSFGLQPWKLISVENQKIREQLVEHSYGQRQVADASHLLVFCRVNKIDEAYVENFINFVSQSTWAPKEALKDYEMMMKGFIGRLDEGGKAQWTSKQLYIALGNVMNTLAQMKIDSCPMEGFNPAKFDEILGLNEKWLSSVVVLPIWYRDVNDVSASRPKLRFGKERLYEVIA